MDGYGVAVGSVEKQPPTIRSPTTPASLKLESDGKSVAFFSDEMNAIPVGTPEQRQSRLSGTKQTGCNS